MIKLSGVVKNNLVKKAVHDKLSAKIKNIFTGEFVLKTKYQMDKSKSEKNFFDVTDFVKKKISLNYKVIFQILMV